MLASTSVLKPPAAQQQFPQQSPPQHDGTAPGLDNKLQALAQVFEMASSATQIDHPLCLDCMAQVKDEIEEQVCA